MELAKIVRRRGVDLFIEWCHERYAIEVSPLVAASIVSREAFRLDLDIRPGYMGCEPVDGDLETVVRLQLYRARQFPKAAGIDDSVPESRIAIALHEQSMKGIEFEPETAAAILALN